MWVHCLTPYTTHNILGVCPRSALRCPIWPHLLDSSEGRSDGRNGRFKVFHTRAYPYHFVIQHTVQETHGQSSVFDHRALCTIPLTRLAHHQTFQVSRELALEMLKSVDDFRTLGSLLRVNRTFYRAYQDESDALLRATARATYGDLLDPMLAVAASILQENPGVPPSSQPRPTPAVFNASLLNTLQHIHAVLHAWLRIYEYRGPLGLLNYREMFSSPHVLSDYQNVHLHLFLFFWVDRFHICASSEAESRRFKAVLLAYWSYAAFHRSVAQYWCICCGPQLPSNMGAFDHLSDVALFQLQSMYDFMYAVVSSLFADFRLDIQLDASKQLHLSLSLSLSFAFFRDEFFFFISTLFSHPQSGAPVTSSALVLHIF